MKKLEFLVLFLILIFAFLVRLYRFDNPIADWHSWRQADTSAVSRNFVKNGFDLLHPTYDDISNIPSGKDNPAGFRFVEFPIYNTFQAGLFDVFKNFTIEEWGRLISIFSSLLSAVFIFFIVKKHFNALTGLLAAFFFSFLPFSIYYGRTILPDEMMVTAILGGIYFFSLWIDKFETLNSKSETNSKFKIKNYLLYFLAIIFTSSAFLLKPYALFFTLPIIYLAYKKFGFGFFKNWKLWLFVIITLLPFVFWRIWMTQFPEGIPASSWLFNGNGIRFRPAFFRWIFYERLTKLILGYFGVVLLLLGVLKMKKEKDYWFFISFIISSLLYLFIIATGNVQHDYYQILIVPTLAILLARGSVFILSKILNKYISTFLLAIIVAGSFYFSWYFVRDYFNINNWAMVDAGQKADEILPKDAKVIAPYNGDTSFLYQINRKGWPAFERSTEELVKMGATYAIIQSPTKSDFDGFGEKYKIIASSSSYLIVKLK